MLAQSFFEWQGQGTGKQPFRLLLRPEESFAMAGLFEEREGVANFTILTTRANRVVAPVHDRMPVILSEHGELDWLDLTEDFGWLSNRLRPYPASLMRAYPITRLVNSPTKDRPAILEPMQGSLPTQKAA